MTGHVFPRDEHGDLVEHDGDTCTTIICALCQASFCTSGTVCMWGQDTDAGGDCPGVDREVTVTVTISHPGRGETASDRVHIGGHTAIGDATELTMAGILSELSRAAAAVQRQAEDDLAEHVLRGAELWGRRGAWVKGGLVGADGRDDAIRHATRDAATSRRPIWLYAGTGRPATWTHRAIVDPDGTVEWNETAPGDARTAGGAT